MTTQATEKLNIMDLVKGLSNDSKEISCRGLFKVINNMEDATLVINEGVVPYVKSYLDRAYDDNKKEVSKVIGELRKKKDILKDMTAEEIESIKGLLMLGSREVKLVDCFINLDDIEELGIRVNEEKLEAHTVVNMLIESLGKLCIETIQETIKLLPEDILNVIISAPMAAPAHVHPHSEIATPVVQPTIQMVDPAENVAIQFPTQEIAAPQVEIAPPVQFGGANPMFQMVPFKPAINTHPYLSRTYHAPEWLIVPNLVDNMFLMDESLVQLLDPIKKECGDKYGFFGFAAYTDCKNFTLVNFDYIESPDELQFPIDDMKFRSNTDPLFCAIHVVAGHPTFEGCTKPQQ